MGPNSNFSYFRWYFFTKNTVLDKNSRVEIQIIGYFNWQFEKVLTAKIQETRVYGMLRKQNWAFFRPMTEPMNSNQKDQLGSSYGYLVNQSEKLGSSLFYISLSFNRPIIPWFELWLTLFCISQWFFYKQQLYSNCW